MGLSVLGAYPHSMGRLQGFKTVGREGPPCRFYRFAVQSCKNSGSTDHRLAVFLPQRKAFGSTTGLPFKPVLFCLKADEKGDVALLCSGILPKE